MIDNPLMTQAEVAAFLQVKPGTINTWASQGKIPLVRINGAVRFERAAIERWVEERRQAARESGRGVVTK